MRQIVLPIETETYIPKDDNVRVVEDLLDKISFNSNIKLDNISPLTMMKIVVYGYMEGITSLRKLEKASKRDINFKWLLQNNLPPSKSSIGRFIKQNKSEIESIFYQVVNYLCAIKEIDFETVYVDGTKIEANANKYTFVWKKAVNKFEAKLDVQIDEFLEGFNNRYQTSFDNTELNRCLGYIESLIMKYDIQFVHGKGKRKTSNQKDYELLSSYIDRKDKYADYNSNFKGRNSFSKTDVDATFMHMKEDHMRNSQLKPGYNMQIAVNSEYIVGLDISYERSDQLTLIPLLEKLEQSLDGEFKSLTADAGYESEENYQYLKDNELTSYIKPQNYEIMKKRKFKKYIGRRENMIYDKKADEYTCANDRKLTFVKETSRKSKSGYKAHIKVYACNNCYDCPVKSDCTKTKSNKQLWVADNFLKYRNNSLENISTKKGITYRINRSIQVEGTFGVLKQDYGFRRLTTRGIQRVKTEFTLYCLAYNINKYCNKKRQNRCNSHLFLSSA
jgi:transposase